VIEPISHDGLVSLVVSRLDGARRVAVDGPPPTSPNRLASSIVDVLERHGRNVPAAAEQAGLDRTYVYRLIRKHGL